MDKKLRTAWIVAGVLGVLLVIAVMMWLGAKKDLDSVLREGSEDIAAQRDRIEEVCDEKDAMNDKDCQDALDDLQKILKKFSKDLKSATTTGSASGSVNVQAQ